MGRVVQNNRPVEDVGGNDRLGKMLEVRTGRHLGEGSCDVVSSSGRTVKE